MNGHFTVDDLEFEFISARRSLDSFKCAESLESEEIERFLREQALFYHEEGLARVVLVLHGHIIVGYFALAMGRIYLSWRKKAHLFGEKAEMEIPALLLARMGVHQNFRQKGIGRVILRRVFDIADKISEYVGFRFIFVDSKQQSAEFYRKFGFKENTSEKYKGRKHINMILDLKRMKNF